MHSLSTCIHTKAESQNWRERCIRPGACHQTTENCGDSTPLPLAESAAHGRVLQLLNPNVRQNGNRLTDQVVLDDKMTFLCSTTYPARYILRFAKVPFSTADTLLDVLTGFEQCQCLEGFHFSGLSVVSIGRLSACSVLHRQRLRSPTGSERISIRANIRNSVNRRKPF
jgi:hypothetical protein